jgi:transcriptional regulator with XRE-family HTH domain
MTTSSGRAPARARLAMLMDERRRDLRLTWDQVAGRAGINRETLRQIRTGSGNIRPLSATGIEDALEWDRGSIDRILAGGDPAPVGDRRVALADDASATETLQSEPTNAQLAAELAEVKQRSSELERRFEEYLRQQRNEHDQQGKTG